MTRPLSSILSLAALALAAGPAAAHATAQPHLHSESNLMLAAGLAIIVTAAGLALTGLRK